MNPIGEPVDDGAPVSGRTGARPAREAGGGDRRPGPRDESTERPEAVAPAGQPPAGSAPLG